MQDWLTSCYLHVWLDHYNIEHDAASRFFFSTKVDPKKYFFGQHKNIFSRVPEAVKPQTE